MDDTDFDALCDGMSAEDVKRLRKILAIWSAGDEESFPVQMALLTRAQWRVASRLPRQLTESRELLEKKLAEYRQQTAALVQSFDRTVAAKVTELEAVVTTQREASANAVTGLQRQVANAEIVSSQIRDALVDGVTAWKQAKADFEAERQKLEASRHELDARNTKRDWLWAALLLLGMIGLGVAIGLLLPLLTR